MDLSFQRWLLVHQKSYRETDKFMFSEPYAQYENKQYVMDKGITFTGVFIYDVFLITGSADLISKFTG